MSAPFERELRWSQRSLSRVLGHLPEGEELREILGGGKHLRPILCLLAGAILGAPRAPLSRAAAALQCLHCAALLYDDILDEHRSRRGKVTIFQSKGTRVAILLGNVLLGAAFETIPRRLLPLLAGCVGRLARGCYQEEFGSDSPEVRYLKTACLFETACVCAATLSGHENPERLGGYGRQLGMAFQFADDLRDGDALANRRLVEAHAQAALAELTAWPQKARPPLRRFLRYALDETPALEERATGRGRVWES